MNKIFAPLFSVLLFGCGTVHSQQKTKLDSLVKENFIVLDSVANGKKKQATLTYEQNAFLFLINAWTGGTADFDHWKGIAFNSERIRFWRNWYSKHCKAIDSNDFNSEMEILTNFFKKGQALEGDLERIDKIEKKYNALNE